MFKVVVVRKDGLTHDSEFHGWFAEVYGFKCFNDIKQEPRTLSAYLFRGHKDRDDKTVWTLNTVQHN